MPAKNLSRIDEEGIYSHIYNKGIEKRTIFNDKQDYETFQDYLRDYLTAPKDPDRIKENFKVHGQIFRGTTHQPKNYFNSVELIAYSLLPDHFHLLLHQKTRGSLERFIRSLCTRYSMYFNKKYQHTGSLFDGPYKSVHIKNEPHLLHLTRYLHHTGSYSSYPEYLGKRITSWVNTKIVLSFFGKGANSYKDFVEQNELSQKEKELIESFTLEDGIQHLEKRDLVNNDPLEIPAEPAEQIHQNPNLNPLQRNLEFLATTVVFLLLVTLGIRNIISSTATDSDPSPLSSVLSKVESKIYHPLPTPAVLAITTATEEAKPKIILTIKIDGAAGVNIRQKPATDSAKIGQAHDGDTFEFVSMEPDWYEVRMATRSGFISATYIREGGINK